MKNKTKKDKVKKNAKKIRTRARVSEKKTTAIRPAKPVRKALAAVTHRPSSEPPAASSQSHHVFSIELDSIGGETTIGDLIVAYPRTRDVLLKRGLRFDVEEAGYLFMTLNVFSALHGLESRSLIQELRSTLNEPSPQPPLTQPVRQMATAPPT